MPLLKNYRQFDGLHWETGAVRNFLDTRGVIAPHTGQPYTEALLMGISGGIVMAYFSFAYEGVAPQARILTRNTFDPMDRLLERLGVVQNALQTTNADKARNNLIHILEESLPAITWADVFSLPYNSLPLPFGEMWMMWPVVVYGYDEPAGVATLADRARVPITVSTAELDAARARVKKDKFRLLTLDPPNPDKLPSAVQKGIWDTIRLFLEAPPKGSRDNFGLAAYQRWAKLLTRPTQRLSWEKEFPAGPKMYAGLVWAFWDIHIFGKDHRTTGAAERESYAAFLDEASIILNKPALKEVARHFRTSAAAWHDLGRALLPDSIAPFKETRELMLRRHPMFLDQGLAALDEIRSLDARLDGLRRAIAADFPLDAAGVAAMRENIASHVLRLHDIERDAVLALQEAMS